MDHEQTMGVSCRVLDQILTDEACEMITLSEAVDIEKRKQVPYS